VAFLDCGKLFELVFIYVILFVGMSNYQQKINIGIIAFFLSFIKSPVFVANS